MKRRRFVQTLAAGVLLPKSALDAFANSVQEPTALTFSAAQQVTSKYWITLVQIDSSWRISSKESPCGFDTEAAAIAALPPCDDDNASVGYVVWNGDSGAWTADTEDLDAEIPERKPES